MWERNVEVEKTQFSDKKNGTFMGEISIEREMWRQEKKLFFFLI